MKAFRFKQFEIQHQQSAMKVGTDGVLLGAWANFKDSKTILDIGSGSGLIALMAAQKNPNAQITAIEIDIDAAQEAELNFKNSTWSNRLEIIHLDYLNYQPSQCFDHIVCNPPFFENHKHQTINSRKIARQSVQFSLSPFFDFVKNYLKPTGLCSMIYPAAELSQIKQLIEGKGLKKSRLCMVYGKPTSNPKRVMIELGFDEKKLEVEELIIENDQRHHFTDEYKRLTQDFYLKF